MAVLITATVTGASEVVERFGALSVKARIGAKSALDVWSAQLAAYIKDTKLSGQVLNRRTGNLSASVHPLPTSETGETVTGGAAGGGQAVPYARIHEFGGLIPAHQVVAKNARALAFNVGGVMRFAKSVQIPDVKMPERSYMRSSLAERSPDGIAQLRAAVMEAIVS